MRRRVAVPVLVLLFALASTPSCVSHRIAVASTDDDALVRAGSLSVAVETPPDPSLRASAALDAGTLRERLEAELRAKGYATASEEKSELVLEATPSIESVSRKTWSSDPDASAPRLVRGTDLVLVLRARDDDDLTLWSSETRAPLPESGIAQKLEPTADEIWLEIVDRALAEIPAHEGP